MWTWPPRIQLLSPTTAEYSRTPSHNQDGIWSTNGSPALRRLLLRGCWSRPPNPLASTLRTAILEAWARESQSRNCLRWLQQEYWCRQGWRSRRKTLSRRQYGSHFETKPRLGVWTKFDYWTNPLAQARVVERLMFSVHERKVTGSNPSGQEKKKNASMY